MTTYTLGVDAGINSYIYVSDNPILNTDPTGLIEWNGTITGSSLISLFGAGGFDIKLESECVNDIYAEVDVFAVGPAIGLGILFDLQSSDLTVYDMHTTLQPLTLDGYFQLTSAAWSVGVGAYSIAIGTDGSMYSSTGATGSGAGRVNGWALGVSSIAGSSTVTDIGYYYCGF